MVQALFATAPGQVASEVVTTGTGFAMVATDEAVDADPSADPTRSRSCAAARSRDAQ